MAENMRGPRLSNLICEKVCAFRDRRGVKRSSEACLLPASFLLREECFEAATV